MKQINSSQTFFCSRQTPFGPIAFLWSAYKDQPKIFRILLSSSESSAEEVVKKLFGNSRPRSCSEIDEMTNQIEAFLNGSDIRFPLDGVRLDLCSEFQQRVLRAEHGIARGHVSTYQLIAKFIGRPSASRAVGTALANNPFPMIIPCHRAIRSDRSLGGYQGGIAMKRALLEMEGIEFDNTGRVITKTFFYSATHRCSRLH
jgi:methylated-DNA-[protein]-cysteine S-methyltransferase